MKEGEAAAPQPAGWESGQSQVLSRPPLTCGGHNTVHRAGTTPFSHPMAMLGSSRIPPHSFLVQVVTHRHVRSPRVAVSCDRAWSSHWLTLLPCKHGLDHGMAFQLRTDFSWGSSGRLWLCNKQVILLYTASSKLILPSVYRHHVWEGQFKQWGILRGKKFLRLSKLRSWIKKGKATQGCKRWASALMPWKAGDEDSIVRRLWSRCSLLRCWAHRGSLLQMCVPNTLSFQVKYNHNIHLGVSLS